MFTWFNIQLTNLFHPNSSAKTVKTTFGMEQSVAAYTNRVYAGWDYAISNKKAAKVKHQNLYSEYKVSIEEN